jgi:hypothetical protein
MVRRVRLWHSVEESTYLTSCRLFIPIPIPGAWMAPRRKVGWLREGQGAALLREGCRLERVNGLRRGEGQGLLSLVAQLCCFRTGHKCSRPRNPKHTNAAFNLQQSWCHGKSSSLTPLYPDSLANLET